uniref:BPTI/Kunitz inhibitor domain-containing protein n=1 Tax=Angiostrongylus cantonensis TaxID=6313 RepID=A0A158P690_ANGCA
SNKGPGDSFLTGDFTSVATIECPPYRCDFPRQVCMRLNSRYQEVSANECRPVPIECLTAANGGIPVGPQLVIQPPSTALTVDKSWKEHGVFNGFSEKNIGELHPMMISPTDICQMGPPNGRFCGFKVMYTYNKETFQCDEFWFPGCTTVETNANLFSDMRSCQKLAEMCKCGFYFCSLLNFLSIRNSALGGPAPSVRPSEGDGEDLGIFGLIQQSIQNAQAIKQGGPQGKQAAAAAAGQILQQFTGFDLNNLGGNFGNLFGR